MFGVIVVDACRGCSTCHGHDAYSHGHCLRYRHNLVLFYQLLNSNLFTHRMLFSREEPLVKSTFPGSIFPSYIFISILLFAFVIYFFLAFIFISIKPKIQNTLLHFISIYFIWHSTYQIITTFSRLRTISGAVTWKGLTTPLTRRVASICSLCAGTVYVVLRDSPTGSITLISSLREIPTIVVLHHPFLFGEIPTSF